MSISALKNFFYKRKKTILSILGVITLASFCMNMGVKVDAGPGKGDGSSYHHKKEEMKVHFINVGKADSALITCGDKNILIDAGDKDGSNTVVDYLQRNGIANLDLVIATHPHRDHIGQMSNVINTIPVKKFFMSKTDDSNTCKDLLNGLKKKNIKIEKPVPGSNIKIGNMKLNILAPNAGYSDVNDCSIVVKVEYGQRKFLFTGDAGKASEHDMMNKGYDLKADVLKVGHHGKDCASGWYFIKAVHPKYAVISTGAYNSASHKESQISPKVLMYLEEWVNAKVYRTDRNGNVIISTDGQDLKVHPERVEEMKAHFINVGKADSALITCGDKNILIDAGDKDGSNTVVDYLQRNGIANLDLVIATHPHRDHIGQMSNVINTIPVKKFFMSKTDDSNTCKDLLNDLNKKNIKIEKPVPGSNIKIGNMKLNILAPNAGYGDVNDCSIVVKVEYGQRKFLFTGDAGKASEHDMMNKRYDLKADVLKVGHHGKDCASGWYFIKAVHPKYAVISTGAYNNASHKANQVSPKVLKYLEEWVKAEVYRTDRNGTVIISTDGQNLKVHPERVEEMKAHFINVGKADSALITCKGKNILIDAGDRDENNTVVNYLLENNVEKLDLVVATHPHRDHIGQMPQVIDVFPVEKFLMPKKEDYSMQTYRDLMGALKAKNIPIENPVPGSEIMIGNMKLSILAPNVEYDDANDCSIVIKIQYGERKFLFTGDAGKASEHDMMKKGYNLKADVLKVGHHGKDCASGWHFIKAVHPKYAVISTGAYNSESHKESKVSPKVLMYLKEWVNAEVYRTDCNGTVIISTDGENLKVNKER